MRFANPKGHPGRHATWFDEARRRRAVGSLRPPAPHPAALAAAAERPFEALARLTRAPERRYSVLLGVDNDDFVYTAARANFGVPGQQRMGKTTGTAYAAAVCHNGTLIWSGTKEGEAVALGLFRALMAGDADELSFIGLSGEPAPPGFTARGYTPITSDWLSAYTGGHAMSGAVASNDVTDSGFWKTTGAAVLAPLLYGAGLGGFDMEWVCTTAATQDPDDLLAVTRVLTEKGGRAGHWAANRLEWAAKLPDNTRGSVWATATAALMAYDTEESLGVTELPELDVEQFVRGHPDAENPYLTNADGSPVKGCHPTLLIVAPQEELTLFAPIVVGLKTKIRRARYRLTAEDRRQSRRSHSPLLDISDDLPSLAPDPAMPAVISQSGGQNYFAGITFHDMGQLRQQWSEAGRGMMTTLGTIVAYPGIRDHETLTHLAALGGRRWVRMRQHGVSSQPGSYGVQGGGFTWHRGPIVSTSETTQESLMERLDTALISNGHPDLDTDPDIVQMFTAYGWKWIRSLPYFRSPLFVRAIVAEMEHLAKQPPNRWHLLAPPDLEQDDDPGYLIAADDDGWELVKRYRNARAALGARAEEYLRQIEPPAGQAT